jgi:hypothetical protein
MSSKDYNDMEVGSQGPFGQWTQVAHEFQDNLVPSAGYSHLPEVVYDRGLPEVVYDRDTLPEAGLDPRCIQYASNASRSSQQLKLDGLSVPLGYTEALPEPKSTKEARYYCSTTRRMFWISVLVAALILAAAIAGGIAGGLTSARHSSLHQSETAFLTTINGVPETGRINSATKTTHED